MIDWNFSLLLDRSSVDAPEINRRFDSPSESNLKNGNDCSNGCDKIAEEAKRYFADAPKSQDRCKKNIKCQVIVGALREQCVFMIEPRKYKLVNFSSGNCLLRFHVAGFRWRLFYKK